MRHLHNPFAPLRLSHVTFQGRFENGLWSSTLYDADQPIARVFSRDEHSPLELIPLHPPILARWLETLADPAAFADVLAPADSGQDRLADAVDRLAQLRYLDRRISVLSHTRLIFQLLGDAPSDFRYLPRHESPLQQLGWLRLAAGSRLTRVIHKGQDCLDTPWPLAARDRLPSDREPAH
jgi:hypothetical protein